MVCEPVFKKLPFYRVLAPIINTTLLSPPQRHSRYLEREYFFSIPEEFQERFNESLNDTGNHQTIGIQLRLCRRLSNLKSSHEIDDYIPPEFEMSLNGAVPNLPPYADREKRLRKPLPVRLNEFCSVSHKNKIYFTWFSSADDNYEYFFTIHLVERRTLQDIVKSMDTSDESVSKFLVIKSLGDNNDSKFSTNSDLSVLSLTVSLLCPLSMKRISVPSRSTYCTHVQCFDIFNYLEINEFKPDWKCPVCRFKAPFDNLVIDGMFKKILQQKTLENEVEFTADGSWEAPSTIHSIKLVKNGCQQKFGKDKISASSGEISMSIKSSPRIQKPYVNVNRSLRTPTRSLKISNPQSAKRRKKQKLSKSNHYVCEIVKDLKDGKNVTDVIHLMDDDS